MLGAFWSLRAHGYRILPSHPQPSLQDPVGSGNEEDRVDAVLLCLVLSRERGNGSL